MSFSCYGVIKDTDGNEVKDVYILPYFKKVDSGSDDSKLSSEYYVTDSNGYYSLSPEDSSLLGSEGVYRKSSDKLYIMFVYGGGHKVDSLDITGAMFYDLLIPNEDDYELNLTLEPTRKPIIDSSTLPEPTLTQVSYAMAESSYVDTSWHSADYGEDRSQKILYDNVDVFNGHQLIDTIYSWGEVADREVANNSSDSYTFVEAGDYTIKIKVREKWNTFSEVSKAVRVKYNEPVVDFTWSPTSTIKGQTEVTFTNNTTDKDNRTKDNYTFKWVVKDVNQDDSNNDDTYSDKDVDYSPTKQYQSEGDKEVTLTCYWNDGFDDLEVSVTKVVKIEPYVVTANFSWDKTPTNRGEEITFDPTSTTGDVEQISKYDWVFEDNWDAPTETLYTFSSDESSKYDEGSPDNSQEVDNQQTVDDTEKPVIKFHSSKAKLCKVTITYSDGWKDVTTVKELTITPTTFTLLPEITLDKATPIDREEEVKIDNTTLDDLTLQYDVDWVINDYYSKYNPDSSDYGNDIVDNKVTIDGANPTDTQTHKFQSKDSHIIELTIRYDNGWQRVTDKVEVSLSPTSYSITPAISTDITPYNDGFVGKIEVKYKNNSSGNGIDRSSKEDWSFNDKEGDTDHIEERLGEDVNKEQPFTYLYPSRKPFSAVDGATEQNLNKEVSLTITYDNGWEDILQVE